tara:strand:- start:1240 stop:2853 length:1614 start_codon:yes stop_codon:yes gene_type:complete
MNKMKPPPNLSSGFTLIELLVTIVIIAILGGLILSAIAAAKKKANRAVCLNNMGQIGKALTSVAHDLEGRMPWQFTVPDPKFQKGIFTDQKWVGAENDREFIEAFGSHYAENSSAIFGIPILKNEICAAILHSPLDTSRQKASEIAHSNWDEYDTSKGICIPSEAISYDLVKGGDIMRPNTVLGVTRNLYSRELHNSWWVGANSKKVLSASRRDPSLPPGMVPRLWRHGPGWDGAGPWLKHIQKNSDQFPYAGARATDLLGRFGKKKHLPQVINQLNEGEGNVLMADGSTQKSTNDDLGVRGELVKPHIGAHLVGFYTNALKAGLASSVPKRRHVFLKDGTTAPRSAVVVMRKKDNLIREWKYDDFKILGDEEFYSYIVSELELLKNEVPEFYQVAKKHVTTFNCTGINGTYAIISPFNGWVNISRGVYNRNPDEADAPHYVDAPWHTLVFIHEIQHCDVDSCTSQEAANFAMAYYGAKMKIHPGWINFVRGMAGDYGQDKWDYHHSDEYTKTRISYEDYIKKNGGKLNVTVKNNVK